MDVPDTRYARSGDVSIAYQVLGEGPFDLVWAPGALSHLDLAWEDEQKARFLRALASFSRLITFDKRGTGLSDRVANVADLETRMDDVRAVMDAAGSEAAALCGVSEGGPLALLFAATYPERVRALVNYGSLPRFVRGPSFPWRIPRHEYLAAWEAEAETWGTEEGARAWLVESEGREPTPEEVRERARRDRLLVSPGALLQLARMNAEIDVRPVLPTIRVPTLVLHRREDDIPIEGARWMAEQIPGARFVELPGGPHMPHHGDWEAVIAAIRDFVEPICLDSARPYDSVLATVLFTDLVGSTAKAVELGDRRWRELLERHNARVRAELARFRGVELDTAGDGFFARFDGPARAIRCACAIRDAVRGIGLDVRAGVHTGECEVVDGKVAGIAVAIGARVAGEAGPGRRPGVADGQGSRRRLRDRVRGPGRHPAQGRPRRLGAARGRLGRPGLTHAARGRAERCPERTVGCPLVRLIVARCEVRYTGRSNAYLPESVRLLMFKSDGSVLVHADAGGYKPLNWMTPPTVVEEEPGLLVVRKRAGRTEDRLEIRIAEILSDVEHALDQEGGLEKDGVERDLQEEVAAQPEILADGLRLVRREWPTDVGPVDLMCRDADGGWVAVEIKRTGTIEAVEQLCRYLELIRVDPARAACRGILAAQHVKKQARTLAEARGLGWAEVDLAVLRGEREPELTLFAG